MLQSAGVVEVAICKGHQGMQGLSGQGQGGRTWATRERAACWLAIRAPRSRYSRSSSAQAITRHSQACMPPRLPHRDRRALLCSR